LIVPLRVDFIDAICLTSKPENEVATLDSLNFKLRGLNPGHVFMHCQNPVWNPESIPLALANFRSSRTFFKLFT